MILIQWEDGSKSHQLATSFRGILKIPAGGWYRIVVQLKNGKKMLSQASR